MGIGKFLWILGTAVSMGLFLVWEQIEITRAGYEVSRLRAMKRELLESNKRLECQVNMLASPKLVARKVEAMNIALMHPIEWRTIQVAKGNSPSGAPKPVVQVALRGKPRTVR
ncbi:MAG: hypothetical protein FJ272_00880 [Planctomycetes bacterium]|nr:hypothetical protein [Planctomycetota bacterium]